MSESTLVSLLLHEMRQPFQHQYNSTNMSPPTHVYLALLSLTVAIWLRWMLVSTGNALVDAPMVGNKYPYLSRLQFFRDALTPVQRGYDKYKHRMYKLIGNEMLVLPNKYVNELRSIPEERLSSMIANIDNFQGCYTTIDILLDGNLHTHVIQKRLTPKLASFVPGVCAGVKTTLSKELQLHKGQWGSARAFQTIVRVVAHNFARISVGESLGHDPRWLATTVEYPENVFKTVISMRLVPKWLKPVASFLLPQAWAVSKNLREAQHMIVPIINERRRRQSQDPESPKPNDFLQWMMEEASCERDAQPERLVHRLLVLALASVHTTSMAATQAFLDLCAHPEYLEPLREEVMSALREDGGWKKATLTKMRRMDSFMRESQRLNPPSLIGFKRAVVEPLTLSDGIHLPKGVHMVMPVVPIAQDEQHVENSQTFDGFRHYRARLEPGHGSRHQFATTDQNNMHFGHGKYSCPGRFFAANTIKIILAHFILYYDFQFHEGKGRPENVCAHEYIFPDPAAEVLFREKIADGDILSF